MKKKAKLWHLAVVGFIFILISTAQSVVVLTAGERRHQEQMHVQDSVNARNQYIIEHHFKYCCEFNSGGETVTF